MMSREEENEYIKKLEKMSDGVFDDFGRERRWRMMDLKQEIKFLENYTKRRCRTEDCGKFMKFVPGVEYNSDGKNLYQCPKCKTLRWI